MTMPHVRHAIFLSALASTSPMLCADQLADFNAELTRLGLPNAGSADLNAIFIGKNNLTFFVDGPGDTSKQYAITDSRSVNRVFKAMKANNGFDSIYSSINHNSLIRTAVFGDTGLCSGASGEYTVSSWTAALDCLGLAQAYKSAAILNSVNITDTLEFQFNRPTTQFANTLRFMRTMRQSIPRVGAAVKNTQNGGSSGADQYHTYGDMGVYFSAGGSFGNVDSRQGQTGYGINRSTVTAGFDYRFSDAVNVGILFSYINSAANLKDSSSNTDSDIFRFAPYVSITPFENAFVDISAGYGYHQTSVNRTDTTTASLLRGKYDSNEGFGSINLGYAYSLGGLTATGYGQSAIIGIATNGYRETGAAAATSGAKIDSNGLFSLTTTLGAELSYALSTAYGVVVPRVFGEWLHEYKNNSRAIGGQFQNGAIPFAIQTGSPVRDWGNIGAGVQMVLPNSLSAFLNYQSLIMTGTENHTVEGGVRWQF